MSVMTALKISILNNKNIIDKRPNKEFLENLTSFQRLLLVTDGTVTELLEQYLEESIKVFKLYEKIEHNFDQLPQDHEEFVNLDQMPILKRKVLLQGEHSQKNWVYAESSILLNHLSADFCNDLLVSQQPIGKLWGKYRTETYKAMFCAEKKPAGQLAEYFNIQATANTISRTYGVYSKQKLTMVITEVFPNQFFGDQCTIN
jgi:chorismate-pyruvate lyase